MHPNKRNTELAQGMKESLLQKVIFWFLVVIILLPTLGVYFLFLRWIGRVKIIGKDNLLKEGNLIFVFNHPSMVEVVWVLLIIFFHYFPKSLVNPFKYVAWSFPDISITRTLFFLNCLRCISIKEKRKDIGALNKAILVVKNGGWLSITPEGGRTGKGTEFLPETPWGAKIRKPRDGIGRIVRSCSSTKVIPIWVEIAKDTTSVGLISWFYQTWRKTTFVIGEPLNFSSFHECPDNRETWEVISLRVAKEILALSEKVSR